jgi:hypothetical protein
LSKRKTWALRELGIEPELDGSYPQIYNDVLLNKNANVRAKIVLFLRLQQPEDWAIMIRAEEILYDLLEMSMPEDAVDQKNHIGNIESICKIVPSSCIPSLYRNNPSTLPPVSLVKRALAGMTPVLFITIRLWLGR